MRALGTNNNQQAAGGGGGGHMIALPRAGAPILSNANRAGGGGGSGSGATTSMMEEIAGAQDTIYLCNFRVSVDGDWLCLKELQDLDIQEGGGNGVGGGVATIGNNMNDTGTVANFGIARENKCEQKIERDWVNYYCRWLLITICLIVSSRRFILLVCSFLLT